MIRRPLPLAAKNAIGQIISVEYNNDLNEALACASEIAEKTGWSGLQVIQYIEIHKKEAKHP